MTLVELVEQLTGAAPSEASYYRAYRYLRELRASMPGSGYRVALSDIEARQLTAIWLVHVDSARRDCGGARTVAELAWRVAGLASIARPGEFALFGFRAGTLADVVVGSLDDVVDEYLRGDIDVARIVPIGAGV